MSIYALRRRLDRVLIGGFGITGKSIARLCEAHGVSFAVTESRALPADEEAWVRAHALDYETGGHTLRLLEGADAVVPSPGIPANAPLLCEAARRGILVLSELDFATAAGPDTPIVAVTGTNGKSTTVTLLGELLRRAGLRALVAGNIGLPFAAIVEDAARADAVVLEVSSFQLEQSRLFRPHVAVLLNLEPNHLERHGSMAAYRAAKERIFAQQTPSDIAVLPAELAHEVDHGAARLVLYDSPPPPLPAGSEALSHVNRLNFAAAVAACRALIPGFDVSTHAVEDYDTALHLPFRQQDIGSIGGVRLVNDSKATSPAAALAALRSVAGPIVLLLGGRSKKGGYDTLARALRNCSVRAVIAFGEARDEIAGHLRAADVDGVMAETFAAAVTLGLAHARPGDALLLSPACSSFDEFSSYEERGEAFNRFCQERAGFVPPSSKDL